MKLQVDLSIPTGCRPSAGGIWMSDPFRRVRRRSQCDHGFALVVTVSLMVMLTLMAVGLLSLSAVSLRSSNQAAEMMTARANARLALILAIGELQNELGPDRRIALAADPALIGNEPASGRSRYLSVHDPQRNADPGGGTAKPLPWERRAADSFVRWLVSGPPAKVTEPSFAGVAMAGRAVSFTSTEIPTEDAVSVAVTPVGESDNSRGEMAWWVDDLGQKASLITGEAAGEELRHLTPDCFLLSRGAEDESLAWFPDAADNPDRAKLVSLSTAELLAPDGDASLPAQERWLGAGHFGLLTDPRDGALKRDLSVALGGELLTLETVLGETIFPPADGAATADDPGGPRWAQLHSFHELATTSGPLPVRPQTAEQMGVYPVIAGFVEMYGISNTVGYSPACDPAYFEPGWFNYQNGKVPSHVMTLHMTPVVKLWNPYNRPLASSDYTLVTGNNDRQYPGSVKSIQTNLTWSHVLMSRLPAGMRFEHRYYIPATTFAPGEVKLFSLRRNTFLDMFGGRYRPQTGRSVGNRTNVIRDGFILGELEEGPFTGHSFWDMHTTRPGLKQHEAANLKYVTGRASGGWTQRAGTLPAAGDGGDVVISDSFRDNVAFQVDDGKLVTWSVQLYQGRVPKPPEGAGAGYERPLVSIKNLNSAAETSTKSRPNIPEIGNPVVEPFFAGNRFLDATWARRISLRLLANEGDLDPKLYNPASHGTKDIKWLADFNPRSPTVGCWPAEFTKRPDALYPGGPLLLDGAPVGGDGHGLGSPGNYLSGLIMNPTDKAALELNSFIGFSDDGGPDRCILFEIPEAPSSREALLTLGQLRHANLTIENGDYQGQLGQGYGIEDWFSDNFHPAYPIGSSRADPRLQLSEENGLWRRLSIREGADRYESTRYDFSWHLNDALWDRTFFSASDGAGRSLNPRLRVRPGHRLGDGRDGIERNAAALFVEGSFNVHSRSVEAWRAFLMAALGAGVGGEPGDDSRVPFPRFVRPLEGMATEASFPDDFEVYAGFRSLTDEQAGELARLIVEQIETRAPFFSLSDFVNRCTIDDAPEDFKLKGLLQAAIDRSSINANLTGQGALIEEGSVGPIYEARAYAGDIAAGVPGYLEQGDLLGSFGHLLTVRSDTFVVRAYGNATRSDGSIAAEAWCEATLQRMPEFLDPADPPETAAADLSRPVNRTFGRRFAVTSFRWLSAAEIRS